MTRILEFIIALVAVIALFVVIGLFLPSHAHVERHMEFSNPTTQVYDMLNHFKRYNQWQPWATLDPRAKYQLEGPEFGVGAKIRWSSMEKVVGTGSLEIIESEPDAMIKMALANDWSGSNKFSTYTLTQNAQTNSVMLSWTIDVDYGFNLFGRYAGLYLDGHVGELMNIGLGRLLSKMATLPTVDYSQVEITVVEVPPADLLYANVVVPTAPVKWPEAEEKLEAAWKEVGAFMQAKRLQPAGVKRMVINTYDLGEETNDFNAAFPILPSADPIAVTGNVRKGPAYVGRAVTLQYRGGRAGMNRPMEMLKAYAFTHGYEYNPDMVGTWADWLEPDPADPMAHPLTNVFLPIH